MARSETVDRRYLPSVASTWLLPSPLEERGDPTVAEAKQSRLQPYGQLQTYLAPQIASQGPREGRRTPYHVLY